MRMNDRVETCTPLQAGMGVIKHVPILKTEAVPVKITGGLKYLLENVGKLISCQLN